MTLTENQKQAQDIIEQIITKAWESDTFKQELITNPEASLEKIFGVKPNTQGAEVVIEDQTNSDIVYFNIPSRPNFDNLQLSDEQLEMVSGGIVAATAGVALAVVGLFAAGVAIGISLK